ncbi:MAG: hypothetical protein E6G22_09070 [Actinobacteria bacterium]|nr:MAG: hypothetical protein E6G22_09070 [Actinomycetota bacterium]
MAATKSGNTYTYTYPTALAAGTYVVHVGLHGAQSMGFSGNGTMPFPTVLTSTNTGFTFEFEDLSNGGVLALTSAPASLNIDYQTLLQNQ